MVFKAARTIKAFSNELLWQDGGSAPPAAKQVAEAQSAGSSDEHTLHEDSDSEAPGPEPVSPPTGPKEELDASSAQGLANVVSELDGTALDETDVPEPETTAVVVSASQPPPHDDEVFGSITKPDGKLLFAPPDRVYATFDDKKCVSKLSPRILWSVLHGQVSTFNSWKHVEYALADSSKIFFNNEVWKLSDVRPQIKHIWGKGVVNKNLKIKAHNVNSDGELVELWWKPPKSELQPYIEALLSNSNVKPMFMMETIKGPDGASLTPIGVCFHLTKPVKIHAGDGALPATAVIAPASGT